MKKIAICFTLITLMSGGTRLYAAIEETTKDTPINCHYKVPTKNHEVETSLVLQWATKAATQSFTFNAEKMEEELKELRHCYTEQGYKSFYDALQQSGNLEIIKNQNLSVKSNLDGQAALLENKQNQWKIHLPLEVTYQNEKEKLTQHLSLDLLVGRKTSGDLGIIQMIAAPKESLSNKALSPP